MADKNKIEKCIELDRMCACIMREINEHQSVKLSADLDLFESLDLIKTALDNFHGKLKVIYNKELNRLN